MPLILPWERFVALRDLVLKHYKNLANNIEAKIEATKKNMFHKAEATSLPTNDKQRLKKIIEKKKKLRLKIGQRNLKLNSGRNERRKPQETMF